MGLLAFVAEYYHYDGGATFPGIALASQHDFDGEVAYYNRGLRMSVFAKVEWQQYTDGDNRAANRRWLGGGLEYFLADAQCSFTLFYQRTSFPDADAATVNDTNQLTLELQVLYF